MPVYNAQVTAYTMIDVPANTYIWMDHRFNYFVVRGKTFVMSAWPYQGSPPVGTECVLKLARFEDDGSVTVGPDKVVKTTTGVSGESQGRPVIAWLSDTRIATCRYEWATQTQIAELWAVNTATLALTLLDQTTITKPSDGASWSMDSGSVSEAGVVCACFNKFTPGQTQNVASPDTYQFAVCEVVGDSFGPWTRRDHVRSGYHTTWRTYPISGTRFLTPWISATGGIYESALYDTATDTLQLASREVSSWAVLPEPVSPQGPGYVIDASVVRREFMEPDTVIGWSGLWKWDGSNLVNTLQGEYLEGTSVVEEIPEYMDPGLSPFPMSDGSLGETGDVFADDIYFKWLGFYIRPNVMSPEVLVGAVPEGLDEDDLYLNAAGYLDEGKFWGVAPAGPPTPYGALGRVLLQVEPMEPVLDVVSEARRARFW